MDDKSLKFNKNDLSIDKHPTKCVQCGFCKNVCRNVVGVYKKYEENISKSPLCIECGQCHLVCPTETIYEKQNIDEVKRLLEDKKNTVVFSIAPATRASLGEMFQLEPGTNVDKKIVSALKRIGASYVFDVSFGADLTVVEEAYELINRKKNNGVLPLFTSCCPSWVKYCEIFYSKEIPHLSTVKSPVMIEGSIIKNYVSKKFDLGKENLIHILVAPCTAKKMEIRESTLPKNDIDYTLTTKELGLLLKSYHIDIKEVENSEFDSPLEGSTAGLIFGNTGGVCEAVLRTTYYLLTGENLKNVEFLSVRGMDAVKECTLEAGNMTLKVAVVNGLKNVEPILEEVEKGTCSYDFIEVMTCPGGCMNGGGQPMTTLLNQNEIKEKRLSCLYQKDAVSSRRLCHENEFVKKVYEDFLGTYGSPIAEKYLHRSFEDKSNLLEVVYDEQDRI